ncbi:MAG: hypothetical protein ACE5GR_05250 [Nitrosopumilus sp.]
MNLSRMFIASIFVVMLFSLTISFAFAHPHPGEILINNHTHEPQTEVIPLNGIMGLEKSTIFFHAPKDNDLPWAFVEGKIVNHVEGYPIIIQIFNNDDPVHFAQTSVDQDGTYEYKFRVLSSDNDHTVKIFEGDYTVKIFKVVYLNQNII